MAKPKYHKASFTIKGEKVTRYRDVNNGKFIVKPKRNVKGYWKLVNEVKSKPMEGKTKQQKLEYSRRYIKLYVKGENKLRGWRKEKLINWRYLDKEIKKDKKKGIFKLPEVESP
jgi:hypothetical protein